MRHRRLVLTKPELDGPHHDKGHHQYDEDFTVTIFFETEEQPVVEKNFRTLIRCCDGTTCC